MKKINILSFLIIVLGFSFSSSDHLIFNRITIIPDNAEFVSIYNPTEQTINLSDYYITDNPSSIDYYNLPEDTNSGAIDNWSVTPFHFIARFPSGVTIDPSESLILSFHTDEIFNSYYGYSPDLSLFEDMLDLNESGTISCDADACPALNLIDDSQEALILFYWDQQSNIVKDVDYFIWGGDNNAIDKTGIGEYSSDTPLENQEYQSSHEEGYTFIRTDLSEGSEISSSGNGITGNDETSENLNSTWMVLEAPELGCTDSSAVNYDQNATIDDGSCEFPDIGNEVTIEQIINNCDEAAGDSLPCDGKYDLSSQSASQCPFYEQQITTTGIIIDYFDITPFNGPHSFTIQDLNGGGTVDFVVWPESSDFQDGFDITQSDLSILTQAPFGRYEVQITGELGAYCDDDELLDINGEWQLTVEYDYDIVIVQQYNPEDLGCTDSEAVNYDENATIDDGSCAYPEDGSILTIDEIMNNCGEELGDSIPCDGQYDLSSQSASQCPFYEQQITTTGIIIDYFDITPFNGPHSFTIQDLNGGGTIDFVVWPTSGSFQDGFDITQSDLSILTQAPFGRYEVQVTGELGAYCDDDQLLDINSEWQLTVEYESLIEIVEIYSMEGILEEDSSIHYVEINPEPYILIPGIGETLDFSYKFPSNSQIRIRIFDIAGRFITSLVTEHRDNAGIVYMSSGATAWDGRNEFGQIVAPGTYLIHIEAYNFSNGKTLKDIAPIVVGVKQ